MKVPVYMTAFVDRGTIREVEIPDIDPGDLHAVMENVFHYGQNDFQPQNKPSVSVGDVAEFQGKLYLCKPVGWQEVTREWFDRYAAKGHGEKPTMVYEQWDAGTRQRETGGTP